MGNSSDGLPQRRNKAFRLFPTCKLVRGGAYSAIYDLDRKVLCRFDSSYFRLFEIASSEEGILLDGLEELDHDARCNALSAIQLMSEHEVGHFLDDASGSHTAAVSEQWDSPYGIINAIIDIDETDHDWAKLISELSGLRCHAIQIRCFSALLTLERLGTIMEIVKASSISNVEIIAKWGPEFEAADWPALFSSYSNLVMVQVHSAPTDYEIEAGSPGSLTHRMVRFRSAQISGPIHCGAIGEGSLSMPSASLYSELKAFNGCLNRKLSIRADGEICNCPSMKAGFGTELG